MKSEMRKRLAQLPFEEKIRMAGELIRFSREVKGSTKETLRAGLDNADPELDAAKGAHRVRPRKHSRAGESEEFQRTMEEKAREFAEAGNVYQRA